MARYVDGFVLVVPKEKFEEYKEMASAAGQIWKKHGALDYKECVGEDLAPSTPEGEKHLLFPEMVKANEDETVWFSFIVFESREHRDAVNAKVMNDPEMNPEQWKDRPMPFDMKRFAYGGFQVVVDV